LGAGDVQGLAKDETGAQDVEQRDTRPLSRPRDDDHLCCIYHGDERRRSVVVPFLTRGLDRGQRLFLVVEDSLAASLVSWGEWGGLDLDPHLTTGRLRISSCSDFFEPEGVFDPDAAVTRIRAEAEQAQEDGYQALCFACEMTGHALDRRLVEYEAKLNLTLQFIRCDALCLYDRRRVPSRLLLDIILNHPFVAAGSGIYNNMFFIPPEELLSDDPAMVWLQHWLDILEERHRMEERLEDSRAICHEALAQLSSAVLITDDNLHLTYVSESVSELLGLDPDDVLKLQSVERLLGHGLFSNELLLESGHIRGIIRDLVDPRGQRHRLLIDVKRVSIGRGTILFTCRRLASTTNGDAQQATQSDETRESLR
jgi:PAS domain-containing protein